MGNQKPTDTIITISISPLANGKRKVVVSGAPEHEMPVVRVGAFADVHRLFDEVWVALMKRAPQVVTVKQEKVKSAKAKGKSADDDGGADDGLDVTEEIKSLNESNADADEHDEAPDPVDATRALDDAGANRIPDAPDELEELPVIEGDTNE